MKPFAFILLAGLLVSCSTLPPTVSVPDHRKPKSSATVSYFRDNTRITDYDMLEKLVKGSKVDGKVWDLRGNIIDGRKQSGDGGQGEDQEPLARVYIPLIIRNGFIQNNKNAILFYGKQSGVERITWLTIGEDAVATMKGAVGFIVEDCEFINKREGDKSIQLNEGDGAKIVDNLIYSGTTGVRIGDNNTTSVSDQAYAANNRFVGVDTAYHASKITLNILGGDKYEKVRTKFKTANGAVIKEK